MRAYFGRKLLIYALTFFVAVTVDWVIPLWYNGAWAQANTSVWTGWPSAKQGDSHLMPVTWRNYWEMGSILMMTELQPAKQ